MVIAGIKLNQKKEESDDQKRRTIGRIIKGM
jgi:hypothetical protein